jgi:hypothetical protein
MGFEELELDLCLAMASAGVAMRTLAATSRTALNDI